MTGIFGLKYEFLLLSYVLLESILEVQF